MVELDSEPSTATDGGRDGGDGEPPCAEERLRAPLSLLLGNVSESDTSALGERDDPPFYIPFHDSTETFPPVLIVQSTGKPLGILTNTIVSVKTNGTSTFSCGQKK